MEHTLVDDDYTLVQNAASLVTKYAASIYYKMPQPSLQNAQVIKKCVVITKCRRTSCIRFVSEICEMYIVVNLVKLTGDIRIAKCIVLLACEILTYNIKRNVCQSERRINILNWIMVERVPAALLCLLVVGAL